MNAKGLVSKYLKLQGIVPKKSDLGLNFSYEGWNFLLWHDADDPSFFRLALPGILDITDRNYAQALMACNTVNWSYKVVKASLYEYDEAGKRQASVWVCYEQMLDDDQCQEVVTRAVAALVEAAEQFQNLLT